MSTATNPLVPQPPSAPRTAGPSSPPPTLEFRPRRRPPRWRKWLWQAPLLAAVLGGGAWAVRHYLLPTSDKPAEITGAAARGTLTILVTERGELESAKTVDVRCEVEGRQIKIVEIVPEGTRVTKGQVVVKFDTEELTRQHADQEVKWKTADGKAKAAKGELEVQKSKGEGEIAKAELDLTLADLALLTYVKGEYPVELAEKEGNISLARKELIEAEEQLQTYTVFVKKGFGTQEQLRARKAYLDKAKFVLERDEEKLKKLVRYDRLQKETELKGKAADAKRALVRAKAGSEGAIAKAQSDLDATIVTTNLEKQSVERFKKQLDKCVVLAPQDGILVYSKDRWWDASSRVQVGATVHFQQNLFSLPDLANMQVKVKVHESMIKKVAKGQKAEIAVEALPGRVLHGTVEKVGTLADSQGGWDERGVKEYVTIVTIDDLPTDAGLKPGMSAEVKVLINQLPDVLLVPVQSVAEHDGKRFSYVVGPAGVERREVTVGENNEKFVQVLTGLTEGDRIALDARARVAAEAKAKDHEIPGTPKKDESQPAAPADGQPKSVAAAPPK
jgi:HlyD family secretion protein